MTSFYYDITFTPGDSATAEAISSAAERLSPAQTRLTELLVEEAEGAARVVFSGDINYLQLDDVEFYGALEALDLHFEKSDDGEDPVEDDE